jgi:hypothetical protein
MMGILCRCFVKFYYDGEIVKQLVSQLFWGHLASKSIAVERSAELTFPKISILKPEQIIRS